MIQSKIRRTAVAALCAGALVGAPSLAVAQAFVPSEPAYLTAQASAGMLYVRVVITPEFDAAGVKALQAKKGGKFAHLAWKQARGVAVTPKLSIRSATTTTEIPAVAVLSVGVNSQGEGKALASQQRATPLITPWVRLDQGMMIDVDLTVQGFDSTQWAAFSTLLPSALSAYSAFGGQWPKQISDGDIQSAGGAVDNLVNLVRDPSRNLPRAEAKTLILDPLGTRSAGYAILVKNPADLTGPTIGTVKVALEFQRSFAAPLVVAQNIPPVVGPIGEGVLLSNQMFKPAGGAPATVQSQAFYTALAHAVGDPKTRAAAFETKCLEFRTGARAMAMSDFDVNLSLFEALNAADWTKRPDLVSSRCFSAFDRQELLQAGRRVAVVAWPPPPGETLQMSNSQMQAIAKYLGGAEPADTALLAATARLTDQVYLDVPDFFGPARSKDRQSPGDVLEEWRPSGVVASCCSRPATDRVTDPAQSAPSSAGREHTLLLAPDPAYPRPAYAFAVAEYWTTAFSDNRAGRILVRPATEAEAAQAKKDVCAKPSAPTFLGCTVVTATVDPPKAAAQ